ncbi:anti-anti-sigma factor [Actinopolyspora alba]|uniref:Anti-sigma factor antagonist n=1 Tax=Actinopolyspora alba TaxID=673379 RepID=A0A1I1X041_9ACTN|nr:STAS domain-containing protein [Actinopolyspora alba]SFE00804.1 anti-anti-sigma factor [Actinopolyspora alba]
MIVSRPTPQSVHSDQPDTAPASPPHPTVPTRRAGEEELAQGQHRLDPALRMSVQRPAPGVVVVSMNGDIDLAAAPRVTELIRQRLTAAALRTLIVDLSTVSFIDTTGVELLLKAQRRADRRGIDMHVVPGQGCVARLLDLTGINASLTCHDSVTTALAHAHNQ